MHATLVRGLHTLATHCPSAAATVSRMWVNSDCTFGRLLQSTSTSKSMTSWDPVNRTLAAWSGLQYVLNSAVPNTSDPMRQV